LTVLAAIQVLQEKIPAYGQVPAVQERFAQQIAFLHEMAESLPMKECGGESGLETLTLLEPWWERTQNGEHLLSDPTILGAEVLRFCEDGSQVGYGVKNYEGPEGAWSLSVFLPAGEYPSVTLWRRGVQRIVRYEDRQPGSSGVVNGIRLTLDLERLHCVLVHVRRAKVRCSSRWKSCPGKGRPGRVAILAVVEATKRLKPGRKEAASGCLQAGRP